MLIRFVIWEADDRAQDGFKISDVWEMPWRLLANGLLPAEIQRGFTKLAQAKLEGSKAEFMLIDTGD